MVTAGIFPFKENSHGRAGNRTRDLIISSQRLWPLDHEAGHTLKSVSYKTQHSKQCKWLSETFNCLTQSFKGLNFGKLKFLPKND